MTLKSDAKFEEKLTCGIWQIWQIFTRALESVKNGTFMGLFCPKQKICKFKIYRVVMCLDNEE